MEFKQEKISRFLKHIAGQKFTWFASATICLVITAFTTKPDSQPDFYAALPETELLVNEPEPGAFLESAPAEPAAERFESLPEISAVVAELPLKAPKVENRKPATKASNNVEHKLVLYAQSLLGLPYNYGGTTTSGFDCSGFVYHVFTKFNIDIERSSRAQSTQGEEVDIEKLVPGDLLFFTGTNANLREVGHVGIVISEPGEPVSFVHSSSNGGVKISELEGYYNTRFMFAKRVQ